MNLKKTAHFATLIIISALSVAAASERADQARTAALRFSTSRAEYRCRAAATDRAVHELDLPALNTMHFADRRFEPHRLPIGYARLLALLTHQRNDWSTAL